MKPSKNIINASQLCTSDRFHILKRGFAKLVQEQNPVQVQNMPIFEYATERTKRSRRVYMWGNTMCGALGGACFIYPANQTSGPLKTMNRPWRTPFSWNHKVRDVACGYGFTVFAASNNETSYSLFGTGLNCDFQIGYQAARKGHPLEIVAQPVPIILPLSNTSAKAIHVACGRAHTIAVTDKEGIFSLGNNAYGQCGVPYSATKITECSHQINKVEGFDEKIIKVVCGQDHTLFLSESGSVYSCGWGADGQTGLGHYKNQKTPARVKGDIENEKIIELSCAADCVLALSEKGDVFGWGNSEYSQLHAATNKQQINVSSYLKLKNVGKVKQIASGGTMCAVLSEQGEVFVWGYGILGQGPNVTALAGPTPLPRPLFGYNEFSTDVKVEQLACSLSHFAAVTNKGHLYMWGKNRDRCLGLGHFNDQYFPLKVPVPADVIKVICGVDHTAALCRSFA